MSDEVLWTNGVDMLTEGALTGSLRVFEDGEVVAVLDEAGAYLVVAALREQRREIERLRGELIERNAQLLHANDEIERLREERDQAARDADEYMTKEAQRDREVLDLRAENERLRKVVDSFSLDWLHSTPRMDFTQYEIRPSHYRDFDMWLIDLLVARKAVEDSDE